jgi:hypothetical protein
MKIANLTFISIVTSSIFNSSDVTTGNKRASEPFFMGRSSLALSAINSAVRNKSRHVYECKETRVTSLKRERNMIPTISDVTLKSP